MIVRAGTIAPTRSSSAPLVSACLLACFAVGCMESRECERARLDAHKAFTELGQEAVQRREAGVDKDGWEKAATKIGTLTSSFATNQVTWDSAVRARDELSQTLGMLKTDREINLEMFKTSAAAAFTSQDQYANLCR